MSNFDTKRLEDAASRLASGLKKVADLPKTVSRIPSQISKTIQDLRDAASKLNPVERADVTLYETQLQNLRKVTQSCQDIKSCVDKLNALRIDGDDGETTQKLSEIPAVRDPLRVLDADAESFRKKSLVDQEQLVQLMNQLKDSDSGGDNVSEWTGPSTKTLPTSQPGSVAVLDDLRSGIGKAFSTSQAELRKLELENEKAVLQIRQEWQKTAAELDSIRQSFSERNAQKCRDSIEHLDAHITVLRTDAVKIETKRSAMTAFCQQQEAFLKQQLRAVENANEELKGLLDDLGTATQSLMSRVGATGVATFQNRMLAEVERSGRFVKFCRELDGLRKSLAKNSQLSPAETEKLAELEALKTIAQAFAEECTQGLSWTNDVELWLTATEKLTGPNRQK